MAGGGRRLARADRPAARLAAPVVIGVVLAAACTNTGGPPGPPTSPGRPTYAIGCQGPLSGYEAAFGRGSCDAVKLAVDEAAARGTPGFSVTYVSADDQGSAVGAPAAARRLIRDPRVVAVIGPAFAGAVAAAEPLYTRAGLASVTASATLATLTDPANGFRTFFRAVTSDSDQGRGAASYLARVARARRVLVVAEAGGYGTGLAGVLEAALRADGVQVANAPVQLSAGSRGVARLVATWRPDALFFAGYYAQFGLVARAVRAAGYHGLLMSDEGSYDPRYVGIAGAAAAAGTIVTCPCADPLADPALAGFTSAFEAAFGMAPPLYSAEAFDAANAVISVISGLAARSGAQLTRSAVVAGLRTVDYRGLTERVQFDARGELAIPTIFLYDVKNASFAYLGPVDAPTG